MTLFAANITVDVCDLATAEEAEEVRDLIDAAIGHYKPLILVDVREYDA